MMELLLLDGFLYYNVLLNNNYMKLTNNKYISILGFIHIDRIDVGLAIDAHPSLEVDMVTQEVKVREQVCIKISLIILTVMFFIHI